MNAFSYVLLHPIPEWISDNVERQMICSAVEISVL